MRAAQNRWWSLLFVVALLAAACSSTNDSTTGGESGDSGLGSELDSDGLAESVETTSTSTTTTVPPLPPTVEVLGSAEVLVGQAVSEAIVVTDPNEDEVVIRLFEDGAPGLVPLTNVRGRIIGFAWEPTEPGEWQVEVTATDPGGLVGSATVDLVARNEPSADMFLAMGDSIAAGFGRDRSDFVTSDECFRSESDSYAALAFEELIVAGALSAEAELLIVACSGVGATGLATVPTVPTDQNGDIVGESAAPGALAQLERATLLNPAIVTLTVGAPEAGLIDLESFLEPGDPENGEASPRMIDDALVELRVDEIRRALTDSFDVLMTTTSAHVVLTTAYNPVASNPVGVDGCSGSCMVDASNAFVSSLNEMLLEVANSQREGRVSVARLDAEADVFEAPNGAGIDALRDGLGPLQGLVDNFTGGSNALCADDGGVEDSLISSLDCAHPNGEGQRAIADVVIRELLSI